MDNEAYVTTRRQLRGIGESFIAGPQYRSAGTIRLAVRPDGFTGVSIPVAVHGTELVWGEDGAPLTGTVGALAAATGLDVGPPEGVYEIADPLPADAVLNIDAKAAELIHRSLYAGGFALKSTLPEQHPVLWPEHFDVAATEDEVNYGVSPGDDSTRCRTRTSARGPRGSGCSGTLRSGHSSCWTRRTTWISSPLTSATSSSAAVRSCEPRGSRNPRAASRVEPLHEPRRRD
jgi:hypothetical protein